MYLLVKNGVHIIIINGEAAEVKTNRGIEITTKPIVLTNGKIRKKQIEIGEKKLTSGRIREKAAKRITEHLVSLRLKSEFMKLVHHKE